ncbi:MAG: fumarate hydratase [Porticoccaceae bacterium]|nr:fumarate hydratase [Porticoccaceae bacterium]
MTIIRQQDVIQSVADALQYISYYHPPDFIKAVKQAYDREESKSARDAMAQILINSRMCAMGHRPICQDTGIVTVFVKVGMQVQWDADMSLTDMVNEGVRQAYTNSDNILRASILADPDGTRTNTGDNTPAVIHYEIVSGDKVEIDVAAKGGGSEAKSKFTMLNPSDSVVDWVLNVVPTMGAGWCPPGILGIGLGGTAEKAMLMAKEALLDHIDIQELQAKGAANRNEELRLELFDKVNALGIGAQGLGGLTTVLDIKVKDYPSHAANKAVAIIPNCAATRHAHFVLDGSGPAQLDPPNLDDWADITLETDESVRRINLDTVTQKDIEQWKPGDTLLLSGKMLTGRDAAHKKMTEILSRGEKLPVDLAGRFIYYVGPVDPIGEEAVGPAGPTTATRMDKFTRTMLEETGLMGMIGKAERGQATIDAIKENQAVYLIAVGGAAYLVSKAITHAEVIAFPELGMEAIYEFEVNDMPVTVAVDTMGESVHRIGPEIWQAKIEEKSLELS